MGMSLVPMLAARGDKVFVTSRRSHENSRKSEGCSAEIHYLHGDAHEEAFLKKILEKRYDAIIDFMVYTEDEFRRRADLLLASCGQYLFLSSSRVYAGSADPLTEESPRLLDVCKNEKYLKTAEYALDKAREENILKGKEKRNWTVIRPYITYNSNRIQLGCYEKENWLYRALKGRTIIFTDDMAECKTTLTYGRDVAEMMSRLIGNENALGEVFHIASCHPVTWGEVLQIYLDVIEDVTGKSVPVLWLKDSKKMEAVLSQWQVRYDRLYDRTFDSSKADEACGERHEYIEAREGLTMCLREFFANGSTFGKVNWKMQAYMDKLAHERTSLSEIPSGKQKVKYLICRYTFYLQIKNVFRCLR